MEIPTVEIPERFGIIPFLIQLGTRQDLILLI